LKEHWISDNWKGGEGASGDSSL